MTEIKIINDRLNSLEKRLKRYQMTLFLLTVGVLTLPLLGLSASDRVFVGEAFVLQNREGRVCAELSLTQGKTPSLILYDTNGNPRATFLVTQQGIPGLAFMDQAGNSGIGIGIDGQGKPSLALIDPAGQKRISVALGQEGEPEMLLMDAKNRGKVSFSVSAQGAPNLRFFDAQGMMRMTMKVSENGAPALILSENEEPRAALGILRGNTPSMLLTDAEGNVVFQIPPAQENP